MASEHVPARFFATPAFFGASLHHFVIAAMLFARLRTPGARLRAGRADKVGKHALPSHDLRRDRTQIRAIPARLQRGHVMLVAIGQFFRAMRRTEVTFALATGTRFGALFKMVFSMRRVIALSLLRGTNSGQSRPGSR